MDDLYYQKYLKYKNKYLSLKVGGASFSYENDDPCEVPKYETPNLIDEKIAENPLCFCKDPDCKSIDHVPRIILDDADNTNLSGEYLYVITTDLPEEIILMKDTKATFTYCDNDKNIIKLDDGSIIKKGINHPNVSLNKNVLSAGVLSFEDDTKVVVDIFSGHYKPWFEGGDYAVCLLKNKGYDATSWVIFNKNSLLEQIYARRNTFSNFMNEEEKEKHGHN